MGQLTKLLIIIFNFLHTLIIFVNCQEFLLYTNPKYDFSLTNGLPISENLENKHPNIISGYNNAIINEKGELEEDYLRAIHYQLRIKPLFDPAEDESVRFTIPSSVLITIECLKSTNLITLNSKLINIDTTTAKVLTSKGNSFNTNRQIKIKSQTLDDVTEEYTLELIEDMVVGEFYQIYIEYTAKVFRDRLNGIYLSNYTVPNTEETKYLVVSQFEPNGARQAYPCFDQPHQKATFGVSIGRRAKYNTLCNMELYKTEPIRGLNDWVWDHYNTTVKMSTYLIAIVVSEFTSETAQSTLFNGKPVKVWAAQHYIDEQGGKFAAETGAKILNFYEQYFDIDYPLPKMDSAAIPHFSAGAMENYGLNTYRLKYLLYFPSKSTERERLSISSVMGHELAHQWFGDLVTCKTWSQIYLNEGFASYVENLGVQALYPEFEIWNQFSSKVLQIALQADQLDERSHPIVNDTLSGKGEFDTITYSKGSSVIRMMEGFLGEKVLQTGLRAYLKKFAFSNAHQNDLYTTLNEIAVQYETELPNSNGFLKDELPVSLNTIMDSWTLQKGFPLVRVSLANDGQLTLSQEPYKITETNKTLFLNETSTVAAEEAQDVPELASKRSWWIPVRIFTEGRDVSPVFWIPKNKENIKSRENFKDSSFVLINPDGYGYYRCLYDDKLTGLLQQQFTKNHLALSSPARAQLIDDYFNLGFSSYLPISQALDFTTYLGEETEYNVWITVFTNFRKTLRLFGNTPANDNLLTYLGTRVHSALLKIGYEQKPDEIGIKVLVRSHLLGFATLLEEKQSLDYCAEIFENWLLDPVKNEIPVDLQDSIFCGAIKSLGKIAWAVVHQKYREESANSARKRALLNALTCTKEKGLLQLLLHETLDTPNYFEISPTTSSGQEYDIKQIYTNLASNSPASREVLTNFIHERFSNILTYNLEHQQHGKGKISITDLISTLSLHLRTDADLRNVENLVNNYYTSYTPDDAKEKVIKTALQRIYDNQIWMTQFYEPIKTWLEAHV